jgi:hypothetical protein
MNERMLMGGDRLRLLKRHYRPDESLPAGGGLNFRWVGGSLSFRWGGSPNLIR